MSTSKSSATGVFSGVRWSAASKYCAQGTQFVVSLILARVLAPEFFGLIAMASVFASFAQTFRNLGFSSAIVQRKEISDDLIVTLYWVNLIACLVVSLVTLAISPLVGKLYGDSRVTPIVAALSLNVLFVGLTTIQSAVLQRELDFKKLAVQETGSVFASGFVSISLALVGFGVWSLVFGTLSGSLVRLLLVNYACPMKPRLVWDSKGLRECLSFGLNLTVLHILNFVTRNADNFVIGYFLGPTPLGYYALAYKLMLLPKEAISGVVTRVLFPALSKMQDEDARFSDSYLRACSAIAMISFPMMAGLAAVASLFIVVILGDKWLPALPIVVILAPIGMIQSVTSTVGHIYLAKGRADWLLRWSLVSGPTITLSFLVGIPWGVTGVAISYAIVSLLLAFPSFSIPFKLVDGLTLQRLFRSLVPYSIGTLLMVVMILPFGMLLDWAGFPESLQLFAMVIAGMISYAGVMGAIKPPALQDFGKLVPLERILKRFIASRGSA